MKVSVALIKKLRNETGAPVIRVKQVLEQFNGDEKKALGILRKEGFAKAEKRQDRQTSQGKIFSYVHHTGKIASLVELRCETDFVARNDLFENLGKDLAMQIVSMEPKNADELIKQEFIKDPAKKIDDLVKEVKVKTGENIRIGRFERMEIG